MDVIPSRDAVKAKFKRRVHIIAPATHKRLFCMISVMTKSPHSAGSISNTVRELQRAALIIFADDSKLWRIIKTTNDSQILQRDLDVLMN